MNKYKLRVSCGNSYMKTITKGKNMNNFKKVGLTALAGSLAAISAQAAEMSVSGATMLTYTSEHSSETTGNPFGMKTNLGFTASGEVNGYTVSYMQTSQDQFAGMSSARLSIDMGDMGTIAFDQGSGSGLGTIDDKTPTAAEEIWDGLDGTTVGGLVGAAGASGVFNYVTEYAGVKFNGALRKGSGTKNADGASSGAGQGAWDFALTTDGSSLGLDGVALGAGYGEAERGVGGSGDGKNEHSTIFANDSGGPVTFGAHASKIDNGLATATDENARAWGISFNVNENLSVSYGERDVEYDNDTSADVTENGEGIAVAYTMGSMKIAGNRNEVSNNNNATGTGAEDYMTEIAVSFAF
jgi:outer membrane protein OmpU